MNKFYKVSLAISFSTLGLSCSTATVPGAEVSAPAQVQFQLRPLQEKTLANGLHIIYVSDPSLPRVSFHLYTLAGYANDPKGKEGVAGMVGSLIDQGTKKRNALKLADDFAQLGSNVQAGVSGDYSSVTTSGLSKYQKELLDLFSDVVLNPEFSSKEMERARSQTLAEIAQATDNPQDYADQLLDQTLYRNLSYGHTLEGSVQSVKGIQRRDVVEFYKKYYLPSRSWLVIAGQFDESLKNKIESQFGKWRGKGSSTMIEPQDMKLGEKKIHLFHKKGLQQTQIRFGHAGIARSHPDFLKLRLANIVLGGAFASRLNQKIRDDLGLTYGISSAFEARRSAGSFEINTFTRNDKAGEAIRNTFNVVKEFQGKGITQKELDAAKSLLVGQFPAAIETVDRLAFNLVVLRLSGVSDDYLKNFFKNVNSITLEQVNQIIPKYFKTSDLQTVVFGDQEQIGEQLKALAAEAGSVELEKL